MPIPADDAAHLIVAVDDQFNAPDEALVLSRLVELVAILKRALADKPSHAPASGSLGATDCPSGRPPPRRGEHRAGESPRSAGRIQAVQVRMMYASSQLVPLRCRITRNPSPHSNPQEYPTLKAARSPSAQKKEA